MGDRARLRLEGGGGSTTLGRCSSRKGHMGSRRPLATSSAASRASSESDRVWRTKTGILGLRDGVFRGQDRAQGHVGSIQPTCATAYTTCDHVPARHMLQHTLVDQERKLPVEPPALTPPVTEQPKAPHQPWRNVLYSRLFLLTDLVVYLSAHLIP